jgi:adenine-specific DNA-methyltransferase
MNFKIISNPPYKKLKKETNLYIQIIQKLVDKNITDLNFLVPRDFIKMTSARNLNNDLYNKGGFIYWQEFGDEKIFEDASPNLCNFYWVYNKKHNINISVSDGYISFEKSDNGIKLSDIFDIRVGAVSGNNDIFYNGKGNLEMAVSTTRKTLKTIKILYGKNYINNLLPYKDILIKRKGAKFSEDNWWEYIRKPYIVSDKNIILVNCKTRNSKPFYTIKCDCYDGSLLGLIPKDKNLNVNKWIDKLNNIDWEQKGFKAGGRFIFNQRSLSNLYID